jgi:hypothetical protein
MVELAFFGAVTFRQEGGMGRSRRCILIQAWILMKKESYNTQTKVPLLVTQREERQEDR